MDLERIKKRLWEESKPAKEINVDWISIPTLDAINILEKEFNSRCKEGESLLLDNRLETRSKTGEDNLQESMPVDVDNHADANIRKQKHYKSYKKGGSQRCVTKK